ncbi:MAG: 3-oxoacyl-ACP synthase [Bacteroidetes bacterium]|nr:3-oxoacyl-ACP synthase [Bacteroidota bacterium]
MQNHLITGWGVIRQNTVIVDGQVKEIHEKFITFAEFIKFLYKKEQVGYPKFYKMDNLSKLGFLTAELVLKNRDLKNNYRSEEIGVVIANSSSSLDTDFEYFETIKDKNNYYPSPSVFVYTLSNILIGEICIRNQLKGENAFLVSEYFDPGLITSIVDDLMRNNRIQVCICGWVELFREKYESFICIVEKEERLKHNNENTLNYCLLTKENLSRLCLNNGI